jgi:hypothetical protein
VIYPQYQTTDGSCGPFWLVKSFNGIKIEHGSIDLLPPHPNLYLTKWNGKTDEEIIENVKIVNKYREQLSKFYKNSDELIRYKQIKNEFNELLEYWIINEYIADIYHYSKKMLESDITFKVYKNYFLNKIKFNYHDDVLEGSKCEIIFKLIYYSYLNKNFNFIIL